MLSTRQYVLYNLAEQYIKHLVTQKWRPSMSYAELLEQLIQLATHYVDTETTPRALPALNQEEIGHIKEIEQAADEWQIKTLRDIWHPDKIAFVWRRYPSLVYQRLEISYADDSPSLVRLSSIVGKDCCCTIVFDLCANHNYFTLRQSYDVLYNQSKYSYPLEKLPEHVYSDIIAQTPLTKPLVHSKSLVYC